jgi:predicted nucleic acid-binding protein
MNEVIQLYLDMNIFKRSFDDQSSSRARLEGAAIDTIFADVTAGKYQFCWSFILDYENNQNPNFDRRAAAILLSQKASHVIAPNESIHERAKQFEKINIKSRDALHLACAEFVGCGYFLTCDDKFLKKGRQLNLKVKVMSPVEFINLMEKQNGN